MNSKNHLDKHDIISSQNNEYMHILLRYCMLLGKGDFMCSVNEVSKYIINKCSHDGYPISNLQLQKILYYVQGAFLRENKFLFNEDFSAWKFGPVVEEVYYDYCGFGAKTINRIYDNVIRFSSDEQRKIDSIVEEKRTLNPWDLVNETHKQGGAWAIIFNGGKGNGKTIPKDLIASKG